MLKWQSKSNSRSRTQQTKAPSATTWRSTNVELGDEFGDELEQIKMPILIETTAMIADHMRKHESHSIRSQQPGRRTRPRLHFQRRKHHRRPIIYNTHQHIRRTQTTRSKNQSANSMQQYRRSYLPNCAPPVRPKPQPPSEGEYKVNTLGSKPLRHGPGIPYTHPHFVVTEIQ